MHRQIPNLPQSRLYLDVAKWGIERLLADKPHGKAFYFYAVGILASLRAVRHALLNFDSTISDQHRSVIDAWKRNTPEDGPEITFIRTTRNDILKKSFFDAYSTKTESSIGEYSNPTITREGYDTAYYKDGVRHDLIADMQMAAAWCEKQLDAISAQLPPLDAPP